MYLSCFLVVYYFKVFRLPSIVILKLQFFSLQFLFLQIFNSYIFYRSLIPIFYRSLISYYLQIDFTLLIYQNKMPILISQLCQAILIITFKDQIKNIQIELMQDTSKRLLNGCYEKIQHLGEGSYGNVSLYRKVNQRKKNIFNDFFYGNQKPESEYFALKKYHSQFTKDKEGIHFSALRQINLLISINHKNIASCHQIIHTKSAKGGQNQSNHHDVYVVLDFYLELTKILTNSQIVKNEMDKKLICLQIIRGLSFLHKNFIIHRDLKPQNIFVSRNGQIKISDFGFAKEFGSPQGKYTINACTRQYRAPQVFFGTHYYTEKSDIWSFGCVIAYIFTNKTLFYSSNNDLQVLGRIFKLRGTPKKSNWPSYDKFPNFFRFQEVQQKDLQKQLEVSPEVAKLINECLQLNPSNRPSAEQLLKNEFFVGIAQRNLQMKDQYDKKLNEILEKNVKPVKDSWEEIQI